MKTFLQTLENFFFSLEQVFFDNQRSKNTSNKLYVLEHENECLNCSKKKKLSIESLKLDQYTAHYRIDTQ